MSESTPLSWSCPACGRRVPLRAARCHCGGMREMDGGEPEPDRPGRAALARRQTVTLWRSLPRDVKAFVVAGALVVAVGVGWSLFGPSRHETMPAILGYLDPTPPPPTPRPQKTPPLKLPWWR